LKANLRQHEFIFANKFGNKNFFKMATGSLSQQPTRLQEWFKLFSILIQTFFLLVFLTLKAAFSSFKI